MLNVAKTNLGAKRGRTFEKLRRSGGYLHDGRAGERTNQRGHRADSALVIPDVLRYPLTAEAASHAGKASRAAIDATTSLVVTIALA